MQTIGIMIVDLQTSAVGLPSRSAEDMAGRPVLRRSVERALAARKLDHVVLLCPAKQLSRVRELVNGAQPSSTANAGHTWRTSEQRLLLLPLPADREAIYGKLDPDRVRLTRRWSLNCWRGGIGGACWFDELLAPAAMANAARQLDAQAVALLCPDAPLADAGLIDATVEQLAGRLDRFRLAISQAPPGLGTAVVLTDVLAELAAAGQTLGRSLAYDPQKPAFDFVAGQGTVKLPIDVAGCPHRFVADTARGFALLNRLIRTVGDCPSVAESARAAHALSAAQAEPWPAELDIELTCSRPVSDVLRPNGAERQADDAVTGNRLPSVAVPAGACAICGSMSLTTIDRICESLRAMPADDIVVTLGGCGDALLHPQVFEIAARLKSAGALAVGLRTTGLALAADLSSDRKRAEAAIMHRLLNSAVDLVCVELDAAAPGKYRQLKGVDAFEQVTAAMEQLLEEREQRCDSCLAATRSPDEVGTQGSASFGPLLVAELIKCPATLDELEPFVNRWRFADEAHIAGLHGYAGQFVSPAGPGWPTCPPRRRPCARINRRLTILANSVVPQCDIDIHATAALGRLDETSGNDLLGIWAGQANLRLQEDHRELALDAHPLCRACDQWHRP